MIIYQKRAAENAALSDKMQIRSKIQLTKIRHNADFS